MVLFGSARVDENGRYSGGSKGDQKQTVTPDYKGEVSQQEFYVHPKGWWILRAKNKDHAKAIARAMIRACNNKHVGYAQDDRYGVVRDGTASEKDTNCDCSMLVRVCVKEGTGKDPGDFTTANEASKLVATGLFDKIDYQRGVSIYVGDILVTKVKGHTGVITQGAERKTIEELVAEVKAGKWGDGIDRQNRLSAAGYDFAEVQAYINREASVKHVDQKGIDLIKQFESCRLKAYKLKNDKNWTIGYGHSGADVLPDMTISQERAEEMLKADLQRFEKYVRTYVTDIVLTQCRMNALVSYCYNRGPGKLRDELAKNCHTAKEYAEGIVKYWGSNQTYKDALIKRRKKEQAVFLGKA